MWQRALTVGSGGGGSLPPLKDVIAQKFQNGTTYTFASDYEIVVFDDSTSTSMDYVGQYMTFNNQAIDTHGVKLSASGDYRFYGVLYDVKSGDVLKSTHNSAYFVMYCFGQ